MSTRVHSPAQAARLARRALLRPLYDYFTKWSDHKHAVVANAQAFDACTFCSRVRARSDQLIRTDTTMLGVASALPLALGPVVFLGLLRPRGEIEVAFATHRAGVPMTLSTLASCSVEAVAATGVDCRYQLHLAGGPAAVDRAETAGCAALVLTTDFVAPPVSDPKQQPFRAPDRIDRSVIARYRPSVLRRPRWLARAIRTGIRFAAPNVVAPGAASPMTISEAARSMLLWPIGWREIEHYRSRWNGRLVAKGVQTSHDAARAFDVGADAVVVSNHGGRALGAAPATLDLLEEIATTTHGELLVDGGVRRWSDVAAAVALGASGMLIGRAYAWALAADGTRGVGDFIESIATGLRATMSALDVTEVKRLERDLVCTANARTAGR